MAPWGALRAQLVLSEIFFDPVGVNTGRQVVEIRNLGDSTFHMDTSGYWLYFPPARWQFPSGVSIPAGGVVLVHLNRPGTATGTEFFTGISGMRSLRTQGPLGDAVGLYRSNLFGDSTQIVDFVQWGGSGNGGEDVAAAAGQWPAGTFVDIRTAREGSSISYDGSGNTNTDWCVDGSPTPGAPNNSCTPSFARSPVMLNEIGYVRSGPGEYHAVLELKNAGEVLEDLGGKWISLNNESAYQFPLGTPDTLVGRDEIFLLHLGASGQNRPLEFYAGAGVFRDLRLSDALSFHAISDFTNATGVLDFVQWGAAGSALEAIAVEAGVWTPGARVDVSDRRLHGSLASTGAGAGVARWVVDNTGTIGTENDFAPEVPVVINELLVDPSGAAPGLGEIEIQSVLAGETLDLGGFTLCIESRSRPGNPACFTLPGGITLAPGAYLVVHWGRVGLRRPGHVFTGQAVSLELDPTGGDCALFVTARSTDSNNLIDYFRWGRDADHAEGLAVLAGIWTAGHSVPSDDVRDGSSIAYLGVGDTAEDYRVDRTPSLGADNAEAAHEEPFRRGDCNDDSRADLSDCIAILNFLFLGGRPPLCADACDSNNDNTLNISDPLGILNFLFGGGDPLPAPGSADCGREPAADTLSCGSYLSCD